MEIKRVVKRYDQVLRTEYGDLMKKLDWPPVVEDSAGVYRFQPNALFRWSVDEGGLDLNRMAMAYGQGKFTLEEYMEFYRGLGYSLCGFMEIFAEHLGPEEDEEDE